MLKEKIGLCLYEVICDEKGFVLMLETQDDIEDLKKENKKSMKIKSPDESTKKAIEIKSLEESMEIESPKEDENTTDWHDKNKLRKISAIELNQQLNLFNHKTKIGKFKYTDIRDLVDNINKNTIGETDAKIKLNTLNKFKNAEIKNKCLSSNQEELLNLFADLSGAISNNNSNNNVNDNENVNENKSESETDNMNDDNNNNDNVNDDDDNNDENENDDNNNENESENYDDYEIKQINDFSK